MAAPTIADRTEPRTPPKVLVALAHPTMRRYVCDLIEQGCQCWLATTAPAPGLAGTIADLSPDAVVTDAAGLSALLRDGSAISTTHVLVIGPDDEAYRDAAIGAGAGAWVSQMTAPDALVGELDAMLQRCTCGCRP